MRASRVRFDVCVLAAGTYACTFSSPARSQLCLLDQLQKLTASEMSEVDHFGRSVSISGNRAIVGATTSPSPPYQGGARGGEGDTPAAGDTSGLAFVFRRSDNRTPSVGGTPAAGGNPDRFVRIKLARSGMSPLL